MHTDDNADRVMQVITTAITDNANEARTKGRTEVELLLRKMVIEYRAINLPSEICLYCNGTGYTPHYSRPYRYGTVQHLLLCKFCKTNPETKYNCTELRQKLYEVWFGYVGEGVV